MLDNNMTTRGRFVFRIKAMALIFSRAMNDEPEKQEWEYEIFHVSHKDLDDLTAEEFKEKYAEKVAVEKFYEEDGVYHVDAIVIRSVRKYIILPSLET